MKDRHIREIFQRDDGKPIGGVVTTSAAVLSEIPGAQFMDANSKPISLSELMRTLPQETEPAAVAASKPITLSV